MFVFLDFLKGSFILLKITGNQYQGLPTEGVFKKKHNGRKTPSWKTSLDGVPCLFFFACLVGFFCLFAFGVFCFCFLFLFCIGVESINNVVLVSGAQHSDSVIHIHVSILFQILFPFRLLQSIEQSSLCYTVGPRWLSILNTAVWTCQFQTPNLSLPPPSPLGNKLVLWVCPCSANKFICIIFL